jgi:predicted nucleic acid-binding Zn ribbon protein
MDMPDGFKLYQCMDCGAVGVKNVVEALSIPDSAICRCDKCGGWKWQTKPCHTCPLIASK